jgi:hypothetical protein
MKKLLAATAIGLFSLAIWAVPASAATPAVRDVPPKIAVDKACTRINTSPPFCLTR